MQTETDHMREIVSLARGGRLSSARDTRVLDSWIRCIDRHGLDPTRRREARILTARELRRHQQRSEELISIARSGIDTLYKLVAGQDYVLMLADAQGVTVDYLGQDQHKAALRRSGLFLGAEWTEAHAGTCAIGACIEAGEPLIVHQSDHFDVTHGALSCTAAPVYDSAGKLCAVLDISLLSPPRPRESQLLALNLVRQTVRRIELANLMAESRGDWVLRLASSPDFLDVDPEAALALDAGGHIKGMTHGAARLMARTLGGDWRRGEDLIGRHVSEAFALDFPMLEGLTRHTAARERVLETRDGHRLFCHAIEPRRQPPLRPRPAQLPTLPAALRPLAGDDPQITRLLGRAAALAGTAQPVLIEGPPGSGKTTLARALHEAGPAGPCICVACESFEEGEAAVLFGREDRRRFEPGLLARAEGGTVIFENLPELPQRLQGRLLKLLAEGLYRPVGALRERPARTRILVTVSGDPEAAVDAGQLRRDLFLRLMGQRLTLPGLHARRDMLALAEQAFARAFGRRVVLEDDALAALAGHDWPGNLQELTQLARHLAQNLAPTPLRNPLQARPAPDEGPALITAGDLPWPLPEGPADPEAQQAILARHLSETGWNISETARRLEVDRSTIHRRIRRYGLRRH